MHCKNHGLSLDADGNMNYHGAKVITNQENPLDSNLQESRKVSELSLDQVNPAEYVMEKEEKKQENQDEDDEFDSDGEPKPKVDKVKKAQDLKEFTLNKFNTIEPFVIKQFSNLRDNLKAIEIKF